MDQAKRGSCSEEDGRGVAADGSRSTKRSYDLENRLIEFAGRVIDVVEALPKTRVGSHIAGQLIGSGTSPAANYGEAMGSESRNDFIHKLKIALKELRETRIWLLLIRRKSLIQPPRTLDGIVGECDELISIFVASIKLDFCRFLPGYAARLR